MYIHIYVYVCVYIYIYTYMCTYTYTHNISLSLYIYIYIYIHIILAQAPRRDPRCPPWRRRRTFHIRSLFCMLVSFIMLLSYFLYLIKVVVLSFAICRFVIIEVLLTHRKEMDSCSAKD